MCVASTFTQLVLLFCLVPHSSPFSSSVGHDAYYRSVKLNGLVASLQSLIPGLLRETIESAVKAMKGIEQVLDDNDHDVETAATAVIQTKVQDGSLIYDLVRRQYSLLYGKDIQGGVIDIAIDTVGARKWTSRQPHLLFA